MLKDKIKSKLTKLKRKLESVAKEYVKHQVQPRYISKETRTQVFSAGLNVLPSIVAGELATRSFHKETAKRLKNKKKLTKKDVTRAIKLMGIKKKPIVVMNSPVAGGTNAFAHPARGLSKWVILRDLKDKDMELHDKVKKEYDAVKGKGHYAVHLGKNMNDVGTLAHELGHVKNREILQDHIGKYPERLVSMVGMMLAGEGLTPTVKTKPITKKDTALKTLALAPLLTEEFFASHLAKKNIKELTKDDKKSLNKAYGTYLFAATSPARQKAIYEMVKKLSK